MRRRIERARRTRQRRGACSVVGVRATDHAEVVADLIDCENKLTRAMAQVRVRLDAELLAARADNVPHKDLAHEIQKRAGGAQTGAELERITRALRQRTTVAYRREAARAAGTLGVGSRGPHVHDGARNDNKDMTMERSYLRKRRIIEETYGPAGDVPDCDLGDVDGDDELDGEALEGDDPSDHDLGDADEP